MRQKNKNKSQSNQKRLLINLMIYCLFLIGVLVMLYPFYISKLNDYIDNVRVTAYQKELQDVYQTQQQKLRQENEQITKRGLRPSADPFNGKTGQTVSKAFYKQHLLGSIEIPKINIKIPLFDTTTNDLLEIGATTLNGTSYPLGGKDTHAVISAHRGLPNRALFTDLPKLEHGDIFVLEVLGKKLAYQVVKKEVVKPDQTDRLSIEPGKDLVTLLTCTPYMINSHRLLVTGSRVSYTESVKKALNQSKQTRLIIKILMLIGFIDFVLIMIWIFYRLWYHYLLGKKRMTLSFKLIDAQEHPFTSSLTLYDKKGKTKLKRQQEVVEIFPDQDDNYRIEDLPKGLYCLKTPDNELIFIIGQNRLKDQTLTIKSVKKSKFSVTRLKLNVIQIHLQKNHLDSR